MRSEIVRRGPERLRVGPWRGDHHIGFISPLSDTLPPTSAMVEHACAVLVRRGYERVLTGALGEGELAGFLGAGFRPHDELYLLAHDLHGLPVTADVPLHRAWLGDHRGALAVDSVAFPPFWRLDRAGLREAIRATPAARFRVARHRGRTIAYAVTGRAGRRGYVQRVAVHPDHAGRGLGAALVVDGLRWLRRAGVDRAVVNTQTGNDRALRLYERLGFRLQPSGLTVLERHLVAHQRAS